MTIFDAAILGVIEGLTEFLPISSTGHLVMASILLHLQETNAQKTFDIFIQLGAICAVVVMYFRKFFDLELIKRLLVAFLPTGVIGLTLYPIFKSYLLGNPYIVVVSLFVGGCVLIAIEYFEPNEIETGETATLSYKQCLIIGLCQAVAIIPGVSRSGATIVGGRLLGIGRVAIVEFSFLLAVPTMFAASGYDLLKNRGALSSSDFLTLAIGFIVSFAVAFFCIRVFLDVVRKYKFTVFGVYRILIALAFLFLIR